MSRSYEQREVAENALLDDAVAACDKANHDFRTRHYVLNDSGKEFYARSWID